MDTEIFNNYIKNINTLSDNQFISLKQEVSKMNYSNYISVSLDQSCEMYACKHCYSSEYYKWGRRDGLQRYKCKTCKKTFNILTNTPLSRLRKKHKWIKYAFCLKKGFSVRKAAKECEIHKNTSFRWRHRFLKNTNDIKASILFGIVEMSSITMYKSYKGSRELPRDARYRGLSDCEKRKSKEKFPVFFCRNRNSYIYDKIFEKFSDSRIEFSLDKIIVSDTLLCSNIDSIYQNFTKDKSIQHSIVKKRNNTLKNKIIHINNVCKYYQDFLFWLSRFKGVATRYLSNYLSWYRFVHEFNMNIKPETIILRAHSGGRYKIQPLFSTEPNM